MGTHTKIKIRGWVGQVWKAQRAKQKMKQNDHCNIFLSLIKCI